MLTSSAEIRSRRSAATPNPGDSSRTGHEHLRAERYARYGADSSLIDARDGVRTLTTSRGCAMASIDDATTIGELRAACSPHAVATLDDGALLDLLGAVLRVCSVIDEVRVRALVAMDSRNAGQFDEMAEPR
jgi:hypothetical protein